MNYYGLIIGIFCTEKEIQSSIIPPPLSPCIYCNFDVDFSKICTR